MTGERDGGSGGSFEPGPKEMLVVRARLDLGGAWAPGGYGGLDEAEVERARRMQVGSARAQFIAGRRVIRRILGLALGRNPEALRFSVGPRGKPQLAGGEGAYGLEFNLSHVDDRALVALAWGIPLGVDLEQANPAINFPDLIRRFFPGADIHTGQKGLDQHRAALRWWVRAEALQKASGEGMAELLGDGRLSDGRWRVDDLPVEPGYAAAVAAYGSGWTLRMRHWEGAG